MNLFEYLTVAIFFLQSGTKLAPVSEAEVRAAFTARLGMPLTGQMLHGTLPFYPSLTVIEGDPSYIHKQIQQNLQEQAAPSAATVAGSRQHPAAAAAVYHTAPPITDTQVAHARLHKAGHRPLGSMFPLCLRRSPYTVRVPCSNWTMDSLEISDSRNDAGCSNLKFLEESHFRAKHSTRCSITNVIGDSKSFTRLFLFYRVGRTQSAPLPLGHPMLQGGIITPTTHYEELLAEKQLHTQQAHNYLKQQIRQTVLTRAHSRGQTNQLDEAPETEESEVIDLTGKKDHPEESEISKQQRDREQFLQQQRDLMMRHTLQTNESTVYAGSRTSQSARPLSRALSSPLVHLGKAFNSFAFFIDALKKPCLVIIEYAFDKEWFCFDALNRLAFVSNQTVCNLNVSFFQSMRR